MLIKIAYILWHLLRLLAGLEKRESNAMSKFLPLLFYIELVLLGVNTVLVAPPYGYSYSSI